ncbi:MAG TPA: polysaccharide deacetylase family protein [Firmicutes bacterium]|nr:polysaccharide deacetylase family protein [Bacillota bacterium]
MKLKFRFFLPGTAVWLGVLIALAGILFCSCTSGENLPGSPPVSSDPSEEFPVEDPEETEPPDYQELGVNELGQVMILMYHEIGQPEGEWCRTPDNFRQDLEALYREGYRLIPLNDFINGNISTPAGTSPAVLTFDDGSGGQFRYLENGTLDPDCAVAILEEFYRQHPDFGLAATFFIYYEYPFRQEEHIQSKLRYLAEKGLEIGNHTYTHANLRQLPPGEARRQLALHIKRTRDYLPGYQVRSLALPYGEHPDQMDYIISGTWEELSYYHEAILLVGANPAPSPFSNEFNPAALPRVRASEMFTSGVGMYDWLKILDEHPDRRFISDGDPDTVVIPSALEDQVREEAVAGKKVITYN